MKAGPQEMSFVDVDEVRTAYRKTGRGPLLVLIHGAEADHTMFLGLMDALAGDFTVVVGFRSISARRLNVDRSNTSGQYFRCGFGIPETCQRDR